MVRRGADVLVVRQEMIHCRSFLLIIIGLYKLLQRNSPIVHIANQINEFCLGPMLRHFIPVQSGGFDDHVELIVFPDLLCKLIKFDLFSSIIVEQAGKSDDLLIVKNLVAERGETLVQCFSTALYDGFSKLNKVFK